MQTINGTDKRTRFSLNEITILATHCEMQLYRYNCKPRAIVLLDQVDVDKVKDLKWSLCNGYAMHVRSNTFMHRVITDAPRGTQVDHINGNKLDNRRSNLRMATQPQQSRNVHYARSNTGIKGVSYVVSQGVYIAGLKVGGLRLDKKFMCVHDAEAWVRKVRSIFHGEFANHGDSSQSISQPQTTPELSQ